MAFLGDFYVDFMSRNPVIMEYDEKKFEEDIEKAKALSLETMALDQYRRNKLQYASVNDVTDASQSQFKLSTCKFLPSKHRQNEKPKQKEKKSF